MMKTPVEQQWEGMKKVWNETCDTIIGKRTRQNKEWISVDTLTKIKERKVCKAMLNNSKTRSAKTTAQHMYNEKHNEVKRSVRKDRKNFIDNVTKEAEEASGKQNMK